MAHEEMRRRIYGTILDYLSRVRPLKGATILDVGCSYGWFLDVARGRGMDPLGIEPDGHSAQIAKDAGHNVVEGYFPYNLSQEQFFDLIIFNDVFEHLPDISASLDHCRVHLNANGLLILNVPNRKGALYRVAVLLDRLGYALPLERLWLKKFPSPHLSYFCPETLKRLVEAHGFAEASRQRLPVVEHRNLWTRIRVDSSASLLYTAIVWFGLSLIIPFLRLFPADITLQTFRKID